MDDFSLAPEPLVQPLDFTGIQTPPFVSPQTPKNNKTIGGMDRQQAMKLAIMLPLAMKAGPGAVQGLLQGFNAHAQSQQKDARQDSVDQRLQQSQDWQQQYQQGQLTNQRQTQQRQFLSDFTGGLDKLDDPAAIDAFRQLYTAQGGRLGLDTGPLAAYAQQYAEPTRLQKKAAEKKIAQLKSEYGADKWMEMGAQFTHQIPGSAQPVTFDQLLQMAGQSRDPNAPKVQPKPTTTPELGSFSDYVGRYAATVGKAPADLSAADIEAARKRYMQADDRPAGGGRAAATGNSDADTAQAIADAIMRGEQSPETTGLYKYGATVKAILAKNGYNQAAAITDWRATQQHVRTLNGAQQTRLNQAVDNAAHSLDVIDDLADQWKGGRFPILNRGRLAAAKQGVLGPQAQQIATALDAQIADVTAELGNVYMGGNSPTDHALSLASKNLATEWSEPQLRAMIKQARTNLQIRRNSIMNAGVAGASAGNPYAPPPPAAAAPPSGPQPLTVHPPAAGGDAPVDRSKWDLRPDGTQKGDGFLGVLQRPDGSAVMSEYSIADSEQLKDAKGNYLDYPSLVPTLTKAEVLAVLNAKEGQRLPQSVYTKAEAFALARKRAGKPLFAQPGEQRLDLYPDLPRARVVDGAAAAGPTGAPGPNPFRRGQ